MQQQANEAGPSTSQPKSTTNASGSGQTQPPARKRARRNPTVENADFEKLLNDAQKMASVTSAIRPIFISLTKKFMEQVKRTRGKKNFSEEECTNQITSITSSYMAIRDMLDRIDKRLENNERVLRHMREQEDNDASNEPTSSFLGNAGTSAGRPSGNTKHGEIVYGADDDRWGLDLMNSLHEGMSALMPAVEYIQSVDQALPVAPGIRSQRTPRRIKPYQLHPQLAMNHLPWQRGEIMQRKLAQRGLDNENIAHVPSTNSVIANPKEMAALTLAVRRSLNASILGMSGAVDHMSMNNQNNKTAKNTRTQDAPVYPVVEFERDQEGQPQRVHTIDENVWSAMLGNISKQQLMERMKDAEKKEKEDAEEKEEEVAKHDEVMAELTEQLMHMKSMGGGDMDQEAIDSIAADFLNIDNTGTESKPTRNRMSKAVKSVRGRKGGTTAAQQAANAQTRIMLTSCFSVGTVRFLGKPVHEAKNDDASALPGVSSQTKNT